MTGRQATVLISFAIGSLWATTAFVASGQMRPRPAVATAEPVLVGQPGGTGGPGGPGGAPGQCQAWRLVVRSDTTFYQVACTGGATPAIPVVGAIQPRR